MGVKEGPVPGGRPGDRRPSWAVLLLVLLAAVATSLSALSLSQLLALRADVEALQAELCRRREERQEASHTLQVRATGAGLCWSIETCGTDLCSGLC